MFVIFSKVPDSTWVSHCSHSGITIFVMFSARASAGEGEVIDEEAIIRELQEQYDRKKQVGSYYRYEMY